MKNRVVSRFRVRCRAAMAIGLLALAGACQSRSANSGAGQSTSAQSGATAAARTDTTAGMGGMSGIMAGAMMDSSMMRMMDSMRTTMTRMAAMSPEQMKSMVAAHRQMAGNMLAQMNSEMRSMNMAADPGSSALVDSLRQDLVRMRDLSGP